MAMARYMAEVPNGIEWPATLGRGDMRIERFEG